MCIFTLDSIDQVVKPLYKRVFGHDNHNKTYTLGDVHRQEKSKPHNTTTRTQELEEVLVNQKFYDHLAMYNDVVTNHNGVLCW
jgi:hypothetical protein